MGFVTDVLKRIANSESNPITAYMNLYAESRVEMRKIPKSITMVRGFITPQDIANTAKTDLKSEFCCWDRAVGVYPPELDWSVWELFYSLISNNPSGFVKVFNVDNVDLCLDSSFVEYLTTQYNTEDSREFGFTLLDKYFLNKVSTAYDFDLMYNFMRNTLIDLIKGPHGWMFTSHVQKALDNELNGYAPRYESPDDMVYVYDNAFLGCIIMFLVYRYNEVIMRGNYKESKIDTTFRFTQLMSSLKTNGSDILENSMVISQMFNDVAMIKDPMFSYGIKRHLLTNLGKLYHELKWKPVTGIQTPVENGRREFMRYGDTIEIYKLLLLNPSLNKRQQKNNEVPVNDSCKVTIAESMVIMKEYANARDVMNLTLNAEAAIEYYKDSLGVTIMRTDAERINRLARKVDLCRIQFENMSNQWNKLDATNFAHDILNEIDDAMGKTTNKDSIIALQAIRNDLLQVMVYGRNIDIKKQRNTIYINYPKGYGG